MAVPKKKKSVSRKRIRISHSFVAKKNYTRCNKCHHFILSHRICFSNRCTTNIIQKYS